jgi:hypothetical protein
MSDQRRLQIETKARALRKYKAGPEPFSLWREPGAGPSVAFRASDWVHRVRQGLTDRVNGFANTLSRPGEFLAPPQVFAEGALQQRIRFNSLLRAAVRPLPRPWKASRPRRCRSTWPRSCTSRLTPPAPSISTPAKYPASSISACCRGVDDPEQTARTYISSRKAATSTSSRRPAAVLPLPGQLPPDHRGPSSFPRLLMHVAEPLLGPGECRSLSFNAMVEE